MSIERASLQPVVGADIDVRTAADYYTTSIMYSDPPLHINHCTLTPLPGTVNINMFFFTKILSSTKKNIYDKYTFN